MNQVVTGALHEHAAAQAEGDDRLREPGTSAASKMYAG